MTEPTDPSYRPPRDTVHQQPDPDAERRLADHHGQSVTLTYHEWTTDVDGLPQPPKEHHVTGTLHVPHHLRNND